MIDRVLLASDGTDAWTAAEAVVDLVAPLGSKVEVEVLHVNEVEYETPPEGSDSRDISPEPRRLVNELVSHLRDRGLTATGKIRAGRYDDVADDIIAEAEAIGAGLIVVNWREHSRLKAFLAGSVSRGVMRRATCPVLVVRKPAPRN